MSGQSAMMDNSMTGAVGAATAGQSSRVNLGAFRSLPRDPSTGPPMPYPAAYPRTSTATMGAGGDPVRYGSGARSELREREPRRSPSRGRPAFEEGSVRQPNPAGPQTYLDWMEALNSFNA